MLLIQSANDNYTTVCLSNKITNNIKKAQYKLTAFINMRHHEMKKSKKNMICFDFVYEAFGWAMCIAVPSHFCIDGPFSSDLSIQCKLYEKNTGIVYSIKDYSIIRKILPISEQFIAEFMEAISQNDISWILMHKNRIQKELNVSITTNASSLKLQNDKTMIYLRNESGEEFMSYDDGSMPVDVNLSEEDKCYLTQMYNDNLISTSTVEFQYKSITAEILEVENAKIVFSDYMYNVFYKIHGKWCDVRESKKMRQKVIDILSPYVKNKLGELLLLGKTQEAKVLSRYFSIDLKELSA